MIKNLYIIIILLISGISSAQNGIITYKYDDGTVKAEESFINDHYDGTSYYYFPNGNLKKEITFSDGVVDGWIREFYDTGLLKREISVSQGIKDGIERGYYPNGSLKYIYKFEKGRLIKKNEFEKDPLYKAPVRKYKEGRRETIIKRKKAKLFYCNVDVCPEPIGGMKSIQDKIVYPEDAKLYGLEGVVMVLARIDTNGNVINSFVVSGIGLGCDEEALRVINSTKFLPGLENDKPVTSDLTIKVIFALSTKSKLKLEKTNVIKNTYKENKNEKKLTEKSFIKSTSDISVKPKDGIDSIISKVFLPQIAKRLNIKGNVVIKAKINKYGFVEDTEIIKKLGYGIDASVESAIYSTEFTFDKKDLPNFIEAIITIHIGD